MQNKTVWSVVAVLVVIILAIVVYNTFSNKREIANLQDKFVNNDSQQQVTDIPVGTSTGSTSNQVTKIKIALLDPSQTLAGTEYGCDRVVMHERSIPATTAPLTAALKELFADRKPWPPESGKVGNFIGAQPNLEFDRVSITNGVAQIYLKGQTNLAGVCDHPRFKAQLESTAKQFSTVTSVEYYLNGVKNDLTFSER